LALDDDRTRLLLGQFHSPEAGQAWADFLELYSPLILRVIRSLERDPDTVADCYLHVCEMLCRDQFRRLRRFQAGGRASFQTWLCVVVRNLSLDRLRRTHGRERLFKTVARLPSLERELFAAIRQFGSSAGEAISTVRSRHPDLTGRQIEESHDHLLKSLTPRQIERLTRSEESKAAADPATEQIPDCGPSPEEQAVARDLHARLEKAVLGLDNYDRLLIQLRFEQGLTLEQTARILGLGDAQTADRRLRSVLARLRKEIG
jgi:RNA polymerase sigma factor (sigma-70 family)